MKFDPSVDWFYKYPNDKFGISFSFENDLSTGDTLSTCTATIYDPDGTDMTSSMIDSPAVANPNCQFTIQRGEEDKTYSIKLCGFTTLGDQFTHYIACEVFGTVTINSKLGDSTANSYVTVEQANDYIRNKYGHNNLWDTLNHEGKKRVLIAAAKNLDAFNFHGERYYDSQAMEFPRDDHGVITGDVATPITATSFKNSNLRSDTYAEYPDNYWKYGSCHITAGPASTDVRLIDESDHYTGVVTMTVAFSESVAASSDFTIFSPIDTKIRDAQCEQALHIIDTTGDDTLYRYKNMGVERVRIGDVDVNFGGSGGGSGKLGGDVSISPLAKKLISRWIRRSLRYARG